MNAMTKPDVPQELLSYGPVSIDWHRAVATVDLVIGYPAPRPACIYIAGTEGWWHGADWGTFLPDGERRGISVGRDRLQIERDSVSITYTPDYWRYEENEEDK